MRAAFILLVLAALLPGGAVRATPVIEHGSPGKPASDVPPCTVAVASDSHILHCQLRWDRPAKPLVLQIQHAPPPCRTSAAHVVMEKQRPIRRDSASPVIENATPTARCGG